MRNRLIKKKRKGLIIAIAGCVIISQATTAMSAHAETNNEETAGIDIIEQDGETAEFLKMEKESVSQDNTIEDKTNSLNPTVPQGNEEELIESDKTAADKTDPQEQSDEEIDRTKEENDSANITSSDNLDEMTSTQTDTEQKQANEITKEDSEAETEGDKEELQQADTKDTTEEKGKEGAEEELQVPANGKAIDAPAVFDQAETEYVTPSGEIVPSPVIYRGFRFWTVAKNYAFAKENMEILEDMDASARAVGRLTENGLCFVLKNEDNGWIYVESGNVRGFVKATQIVTGEDAQVFIAVYEEGAALKAKVSGTDESVDTVAPMATELIQKEENGAFDHYRATVYQTVVQKDYALPNISMVNIREGDSDGSRVIGVLASNGICYIIADKDKEWVYVESGDVRGFVKRDQIKMSSSNSAMLLDKEEDDYALATESVKPEENGALYYTITSVQTGVPDGMMRSSLLQYAAEFIGNPYVWGGTSLTNGADCSGFVQSIFAQYGYSLPRTAAEQSQVGTQIPVEDAQPGDLIFYGNGNRIYHVVIYAGDGKTIEAKSRKYGIVSSDVSYASTAWAVRIIDENEAIRFDIPKGMGKIHTYMGWQKVTMKGSQQYAFREAAGMTFDSEGFAVVDNRYVIACTTTFGNIGDYVDFYQIDGTVVPCIIGDFKNQNDAGCNVYGHLNGECIVEFVVDQNSWYGNGHANPGTASCHPEWNKTIVKAENVGSFYD